MGSIGFKSGENPRGERNVNKLPKNAFQPGCAPGPGRPKGMRNRLTEVALAALSADFEQHGPATIAEVRRTKPAAYLSIVASLLPRQVQTQNLNPLSDISDDELAMIEEMLVATRAKLVSKMERQNGSADEPETP